MKLLIIFLSLVHLAVTAVAQDKHLVDSLQSALKIATHDTHGLTSMFK